MTTVSRAARLRMTKDQMAELLERSTTEQFAAYQAELDEPDDEPRHTRGYTRGSRAYWNARMRWSGAVRAEHGRREREPYVQACDDLAVHVRRLLLSNPTVANTRSGQLADDVKIIEMDQATAGLMHVKLSNGAEIRMSMHVSDYPEED